MHKLTLVSHTADAEAICEMAARSCYRSESKTRDPNATNPFLRGLIKAGHESVLEHASATFLIEDVSRALTHQLIRHRIASYTQESQRYCTSLNFATVMPDTFNDIGGDIVVDKVNKLYDEINALYNDMCAIGIPKEDARYILPNACCTKITMTANFRQWRHIIALRADKTAQWEIRALANDLLDVLFDIAPNVFGDLVER